MNDKVRMFIGTSANGEDFKAEAAYEHTLRKNTTRDLEIVWMRKVNDARLNEDNKFWHGWNDKQWSTPFSGFRWGIPEYCNFEGKAIYTDVDMLNFRDIGDLFDLEIPEGKLCLARDGKRFGGKEFCVMLFDCARWKSVMQPAEQWKHVDHFHQQYIQLVQQNNVVGDLDPRWNSHDGDVDPFWILHYTHMPTQPWQPEWFKGVPEEHPRKDLVDLFWNTFDEAKWFYPFDESLLENKVEYGGYGK